MEIDYVCMFVKHRQTHQLLSGERERERDGVGVSLYFTVPLQKSLLFSQHKRTSLQLHFYSAKLLYARLHTYHVQETRRIYTQYKGTSYCRPICSHCTLFYANLFVIFQVRRVYFAIFYVNRVRITWLTHLTIHQPMTLQSVYYTQYN